MLQALKLNVVSYHQPISSLNLVKESTPLTALEIRKQTPLLHQQRTELCYTTLTISTTSFISMSS